MTSDPAGINCTLSFGDPTGTCSFTFEAGTRVKLKAVAAGSSKFVGWSLVNSCPKPKSFRVEAEGRTSASRSSSSPGLPDLPAAGAS